ncbi:uncharacterized protein BDR25DRAFT_360775 [Lindgomyces ingoldianus]|uniref:Uncharacterized protein n=1 Tax=Lindgomyces ingoldianus TaxID=673940 RepID=A0ACB6QDW5_9PLEO|nr:uncharacterized protein BDR25DRAFT_360775 [Lindgomyces ingoldianus]KAF2465153.1 hypothetical protein BDR25DRAFT_360775 [Lindgomyces ingoldianus]
MHGGLCVLGSLLTSPFPGAGGLRNKGFAEPYCTILVTLIFIYLPVFVLRDVRKNAMCPNPNNRDGNALLRAQNIINLLTSVVTWLLGLSTFLICFQCTLTKADPHVFRIRTTDPSSVLDLQFLRQDDSTDLVATLYYNTPSEMPWQFNMTADSVQNPGYEFMNSTAELILFGRKFYQWDPEPARLSLIVEPKEVAKRGYPGTPWPSVYITARWSFNISEGNDGVMLLEHGYDHGGWWTQPDDLDGRKWRVYWWNGQSELRTANPEVDATRNVQLRGIEICQHTLNFA